MHLSKVNNSHKESCCLDQVYHLNIMGWIAHMVYGSDLEYTPINLFRKRSDVEKLPMKIEKHLQKYCYYCNDCDFVMPM